MAAVPPSFPPPRRGTRNPKVEKPFTGMNEMLESDSSDEESAIDTAETQSVITSASNDEANDNNPPTGSMERLRLENEELKRQLLNRENVILQMKGTKVASMPSSTAAYGTDQTIIGDGLPVPLKNGALPRPKDLSVITTHASNKSHQTNSSDDKASGNMAEMIPVSKIFNDKKTVWRLPYNGKKPAERRILGISLHTPSPGQEEPRPGGERVSYVNFVDLRDIDYNAVRIRKESLTSLHMSSLQQIKYPLALTWYDPELGPESMRELPLSSTARLLHGHQTQAFMKIQSRKGALPRSELCFSVVTATRTLDVAVESKREVQSWTESITLLLKILHPKSTLYQVPSSPKSSPHPSPERHISFSKHNNNDDGSNTGSPTNTDPPVYVSPQRLPPSPSSHPRGLQLYVDTGPSFPYQHPQGAMGSPMGGIHSLPSSPSHALIGTQRPMGNGSGFPPYPTNLPMAPSSPHGPIMNPNPNPNPMINGHVYDNRASFVPSPIFDQQSISSSNASDYQGQSNHVSNTSNVGDRINQQQQQQQQQQIESVLNISTNMRSGRNSKWKENLFNAAHSGDVNLLSAVLEGGAPVDTAFTAKESMSKAARKNLTHASGGDTALIISARRGHVNSVRLCLQYGAKNDPYTEGITALHAAVQNDQYEVCEILLQTATKASRSAGTVICNLVDHNQDSPTHIACREGKHELLEVLLHHGGDTTLRDGKGYTVLHLACIGGHLECIEIILDQDDSIIDAYDHSGKTALHICTIRNHIDSVRLLLQYAANPLLKTRGEGVSALSALEITTKKGYTNIGVLLLEYETSVLTTYSEEIESNRVDKAREKAREKGMIEDSGSEDEVEGTSMIKNGKKDQDGQSKDKQTSRSVASDRDELLRKQGDDRVYTGYFNNNSKNGNEGGEEEEEEDEEEDDDGEWETASEVDEDEDQSEQQHSPNTAIVDEEYYGEENHAQVDESYLIEYALQNEAIEAFVLHDQYWLVYLDTSTSATIDNEVNDGNTHMNGIPYYVDPAGHSQWEDPREVAKEMEIVEMVQSHPDVYYDGLKSDCTEADDNPSSSYENGDEQVADYKSNEHVSAITTTTITTATASIMNKAGGGMKTMTIGPDLTLELETLAKGLKGDNNDDDVDNNGEEDILTLEQLVIEGEGEGEAAATLQDLAFEGSEDDDNDDATNMHASMNSRTEPFDPHWVGTHTLPSVIPLSHSARISSSSSSESSPSSSTSYKYIPFSQRLSLQLCASEDVDAYWVAIEESRVHLEATLPTTAVPSSLQEAHNLMKEKVEDMAAKKAFHYFIWAEKEVKEDDNRDTNTLVSLFEKKSGDAGSGNDSHSKPKDIGNTSKGILVGHITLFNRVAPSVLEIGYWIHFNYIRQGIMTAATHYLSQSAFNSISTLQCIHIDHDLLVESTSGGIPRRLGWQRLKEIQYDARPSKGGTSGILVVWEITRKDMENYIANEKQQGVNAMGSGTPEKGVGIKQGTKANDWVKSAFKKKKILKKGHTKTVPRAAIDVDEVDDADDVVDDGGEDALSIESEEEKKKERKAKKYKGKKTKKKQNSNGDVDAMALALSGGLL